MLRRLLFASPAALMPPAPALAAGPIPASRAVPGGAGRYNLVVDGGVAPSATVDNTAALNAGLARAAQLGLEAYLPPLVNPDGKLGSYLVSGALQVGGVHAPGSSGRTVFRGVKGQTIIRTTSTTAHGLHVGNGTQLPDGDGLHLVEGLRIVGPTERPARRSGQVGILLDAATRAVVRDCVVSGFDIGYDMINNCFLSLFQNCDAGFGGTCNVGANCRSDAKAGCGNQIAFDNCRLGGQIAGVNVGAPVNGSPNIDGISIRNGQIGCLGGTDECGAVRIGIDYLTGSTGGTGKVLIDTVDMEQFAGWGVRAYGQVALTWRDCPVISTGAAIGVWKVTDGGNGTLIFEGLDVTGPFSSPVACSYAGYGGTTILERATVTDGATFAGKPANTQSLLCQSAMTIGRYEGHDYIAGDAVYSAGTWQRTSGGTVQTSTDRVNWTGLARVAPQATAYLNGLPPVAGGRPPFAAWNTFFLSGRNGQAVPELADVSGFGNNLLQALAARQPTLVANAANNRNGLRFNPSGSPSVNPGAASMATAGPLNLPHPQLLAHGASDFTLILHYIPQAPVPGTAPAPAFWFGGTNGYGGLMAVIQSGGAQSAMGYRATAGNFASAAPGTAPGTATSGAQQLILTWTATTGAGTVQLNGGPAATFSSPADQSSYAVLALGATGNPTLPSPNFIFLEAVAYQAAMSPGEAAAWTAYKKNTWGGS